MRNFQIVLLGVFGFFIVAGVIAFATFSGRGADRAIEPVTMWGTISEEDFYAAYSAYTNEYGNTLQVTYQGIREDVFDTELTEALAENRGPDLILLPHDRILSHAAKLQIIPFTAFPERDFKDQFISQGEIFFAPGGTFALPFAVDPLVMYWNRTHFANASLSLPPQTWDDIAPVINRLTTRDETGSIEKSGVGLGSFANVSHAKEILTALLLQTGDDIVVRNEQGAPTVVFGGARRAGETAAESVLRFYTEFSNPTRALYTWNRSLPVSQTMFLSGDLSVYFGFGSELFTLQDQNPNLNFDVAMLPQIVGTDEEVTFGRMYGIAITNASPRAPSALFAATALSSEGFGSAWEEQIGLPPVQRSIIAAGTPDAFRETFRKSALIAQAFLDPDPTATKLIFETMVDNVTSGRESISTAVVDAAGAFRLLVR